MDDWYIQMSALDTGYVHFLPPSFNLQWTYASGSAFCSMIKKKMTRIKEEYLTCRWAASVQVMESNVHDFSCPCHTAQMSVRAEKTILYLSDKNTILSRVLLLLWGSSASVGFNSSLSVAQQSKPCSGHLICSLFTSGERKGDRVHNIRHMVHTWLHILYIPLDL